MIKNRKGFTFVEVVLLLVVFILVGFVIQTQVFRDQRELTPNEIVEPFTYEGVVVESGLGSFSMKIPNGWTLLSATDDDRMKIYDIQPILYIPEETVIIEDMKSSDLDGDGVARFRALILDNDNYGGQHDESAIKSGDKIYDITFKTDSGLEGKKYRYISADDFIVEGPGRLPAQTTYTYEFYLGSKVFVVFYDIFVANPETTRILGLEADDPDQSELVDNVVKTLIIKENYE